MEVEYVGAKVIAELWGWKQSKVTAYCRAGKIYGAEQEKKDVRGGFRLTR